MTVELSSVSKGAGGHSDCTVYEAYLEVDYTVNNAPNMSNISASHVVIKGGNIITVYTNSTTHGVNDTDGDSLTLYCDTTSTPTAANTDCTGGTTTDSTDPFDMTCTFAVVFGFLGRYGYRKFDKKRLEKKIKKMHIEKSVLIGLMKKAQIQRYKENKISELVYKIRMKKYKEKINKIKEELPVLEEKLDKLRKIRKSKNPRAFS
ncbi:hypothetical protein CMI47_22315 [Candidatus Pacearchaeota archaeon]|nr:hypothetical protein [Candidatus Pacearchaeota archaeon]|tara:strand:- start:6603 stop:7217 length:615 start_codon:yes stop_codon:yes gene_type:complete